MAQEGYDYVNDLLRRIRVDASGRLVIVPWGQYLETPPTLSDEDYYQFTLTSDGKLRTDDPTTQAKVDEVLTILESAVYGNEAIQDAITAAQVDLDNPGQYKADVSALALQATLLTVAGYLDTEIAAIITALGVAQTDLDNPGQYKADVSALALEATLTAIKGTSWSTETLKAIYDLIAGLTAERGTDGAALASAWTAALATALGNYTEARATNLDQLDFALQEAIAALQTDLDNPGQYKADVSALALEATLQTVAGYLDTEIQAIITAVGLIPTTMRGTDNAALASAWTAALATALGNYTAGRAAYLDELDFCLQEAIAAIPTTAMRGTDNALLAANYTVERGTDSAALASSWTAALATALSAYTAAKAAYLDIAISAIWDEVINDHTTANSMAEFLKWSMGFYIFLYEHFEAVTGADYIIPYTTTTGGTATLVPVVDDVPSIVRLLTGGAQNDYIELESDRTVSLAALGGTKLVIEFRAKINSEASILWTLGLHNLTTNADRVYVRMDTNTPAINTGGIMSDVAGAASYVETNLSGLFDLTEFHVYRLEYIPETSIELFVDDVSQGSETTGANVPPDQSWTVYATVYARAAAAKSLDIDYYKVWSE